MNKSFSLMLVVPMVLVVSQAVTSPATGQAYFQSGGLAIRGYDPVSYFTEGRPVQGSPRWTLSWSDATWQFSSAANRQRFQANPEQYAPQYGGYCAFAVSRGYTAPVDPHAWRIVNDRLYLNYDRSVRTLWERDRNNNISRANRNWPDILDDLQ